MRGYNRVMSEAFLKEHLKRLCRCTTDAEISSEHIGQRGDPADLKAVD
jgi:hypothetical protein